MSEVKSILKAKNKDYLLGWIDCFIFLKNQSGFERVDLTSNSLIFSSEANKILGPSYLDLTCTCGNYIAFKNANEIPDKSFKCSLCERVYMIYYSDEEKKLCETSD